MKSHELAKKLLELPEYEVFYSVPQNGGWFLSPVEAVGVFNEPNLQVHLWQVQKT